MKTQNNYKILGMMLVCFALLIMPTFASIGFIDWNGLVANNYSLTTTSINGYRSLDEIYRNGTFSESGENMSFVLGAYTIGQYTIITQPPSYLQNSLLGFLFIDQSSTNGIADWQTGTNCDIAINPFSYLKFNVTEYALNYSYDTGSWHSNLINSFIIDDIMASNNGTDKLEYGYQLYFNIEPYHAYVIQVMSGSFGDYGCYVPSITIKQTSGQVVIRPLSELETNSPITILVEIMKMRYQIATWMFQIIQVLIVIGIITLLIWVINWLLQKIIKSVSLKKDR